MVVCVCVEHSILRHWLAFSISCKTAQEVSVTSRAGLTSGSRRQCAMYVTQDGNREVDCSLMYPTTWHGRWVDEVAFPRTSPFRWGQ